mmetsp:Transcript_61090/g.162240  ORF Transcript_61090/g.162240 Transcript_61090/m.162240 type:complete len:201 (+) Transcript_61090:1457-2059(+)
MIHSPKSWSRRRQSQSMWSCLTSRSRRRQCQPMCSCPKSWSRRRQSQPMCSCPKNLSRRRQAQPRCSCPDRRTVRLCPCRPSPPPNGPRHRTSMIQGTCHRLTLRLELILVLGFTVWPASHPRCWRRMGPSPVPRTCGFCLQHRPRWAHRLQWRRQLRWKVHPWRLTHRDRLSRRKRTLPTAPTQAYSVCRARQPIGLQT